MSNFIVQSGAGAFLMARDPRLGFVTATLKCWAPDAVTALYAPAPDIGISIPEWNPRQISSRPAGDKEGFDVVISYEGHPDGDKASAESFEVEGSTADEPIENHHDLQVLKKVYGPTKTQNGRILFPEMIKDKGTGQTAHNPMYGVESWVIPSIIWNRNWVSQTLPGDIVSDIGTITSSPPGNPPQLSGDRNWLCLRVRATFRGNVWQLQQSWELSKPHGFVPEMYRRV
jgi:hypothetical protein